MDTIENQHGISPNQDGKPKNKIELWKKFLVVIVILFMLAGSFGEILKYISEDFFWKVYIKAFGPISVFGGFVVFPTMAISGLIEVYFSIMQDRTGSLTHGYNQLESTPKSNWIHRLPPISLLIILDLLIAIIYLVLLFFYLILSALGGSYHPDSSMFFKILVFVFMFTELFIPFIITRSWALSIKRILCLLISFVIFSWLLFSSGGL